MRIPLPQKPLTIYDYQDISLVFSIDNFQSFLLDLITAIPGKWELQPTTTRADCYTFCFKNISITLENNQISFSGK